MTSNIYTALYRKFKRRVLKNPSHQFIIVQPIYRERNADFLCIYTTSVIYRSIADGMLPASRVSLVRKATDFIIRI